MATPQTQFTDSGFPKDNDNQAWKVVVSAGDIFCNISVETQRVQQKLLAIWHSFIQNDSNSDIADQISREEDLLLALLMACNVIAKDDGHNGAGEPSSSRSLDHNIASVFLKADDDWKYGIQNVSRFTSYIFLSRHAH